MTYLIDVNLLVTEGLVNYWYVFCFGGFIARKMMDGATLVSSVLSIVELEPKKN